MHEYSIVQSLVERVEHEARGRAATHVHKLRVEIGELSGVDTTLLATAFDTFKPGTICATASLEITPIAALWRCPRCGASPARGALLRCKPCNVPAQLAAGDEIVLASIDLEVAHV